MRKTYLIPYLFMYLFSAQANSAGARNSCFNNTLKELVGKPIKARVPKLIKLPKKLNKDRRLVWNNFAGKSELVNEIDNFVSPATQTFIFHKNALNTDFDYLKNLQKNDSIIVNILKSKGKDVDGSKADILTMVENRIRTASEIIAAGIKRKEGKVSSTELNLFFLNRTKGVLGEIQLDETLAKGIRELTIEDLNLFMGQEGKSLNIGSFEPSKSFFKTSFLESIDISKKLEENFGTVSSLLSSKLKELPVGISYRPLELTHTVRFGDLQFYGNYGEFRSTPRAAFEKGAKKMGGMVDTEFYANSRKKKSLAITLDRTHRSLDRIYQVPRRCSLSPQVCGTYPPYTLISHGIPAVSPSYVVPEVQNIFYYLSGVFKSPNIKKVKISHLSARTPIILPVMIFHGAGGIMEISVTSGAVYGTFILVSEAIDNLTGERTVVNLGDVRDIEERIGTTILE